MNKVIIISGPTASGKTSTSIRAFSLAAKKQLKSAVVNFDSLLFYKELNIGTAKPTEEEIRNVDHHLINIESAKDPLNASAYIKMAENKIKELHQEGITPILVGGSGFYLRALIKGMYDSAPVNQKVKNELEKEFNEKGISPFINFLKENDPESLKSLHENDHYRIIRAVEHFKTIGSPISLEKKRMDKENPYDFSVNAHPNWDILHIYLDLPKDEHWEVIEKRTEQMIQDGLIQEVENLLNSGFSGDEKPLQSIGYKETISYIKGLFETKNDYINRISISTRQLAKSQRTFFKKVTPKKEFHPIEDVQSIDQTIIKFLES